MTDRVRGIICDLDGVVYRGDQPCPGAAQGLRDARDAGVDLLFLTNNASRTPDQVAAHLGRMGVPASPREVLTSSQVGAAHLAGLRDQEGHERSTAQVLAVGGPGVAAALQAEGLRTLRPDEVGPQGPTEPIWAVLQGYGPDLTVADLHEAAYAIAAGATWVGTNADGTLPTARGLAPGNGALLAAVAHGTGATPVVVGKPFSPAYRTALDRLGLPPSEVLAIGDRLDTDIQGALTCDIPAALVLTGVTDQAAAAAAPSTARPTYVVATIPDLAHLWA